MLPPPTSRTTGEPSWRYRRIMAFAIAAFCAFMLAYLVNKADTELNRTIASGALAVLGLVFLLYSGFATVQDLVAIWRTGSALPYAPRRPIGYPPDIAPPEPQGDPEQR